MLCCTSLLVLCVWRSSTDSVGAPGPGSVYLYVPPFWHMTGVLLEPLFLCQGRNQKSGWVSGPWPPAYPASSRCSGAFPASRCQRTRSPLSCRGGGLGCGRNRATASVSYPLLAAPELPAEPSLRCVTGFRPPSSCPGKKSMTGVLSPDRKRPAHEEWWVIKWIRSDVKFRLGLLYRLHSIKICAVFF